MHIHINSRQWRTRCRSNNLPIVEAHHSHVVRNLDATLAQSISYPTSQLIAPTKNSIEWFFAIKQNIHSLIAPAFLPGSRQNLLVDQRQAMFTQHGAHALFTQLDRFETQRPRNMRQVTPPNTQ